MLRMPIKTFAVSAALALAVVLITMPLGGTVQAASPKDGWMMHAGGGSARFEPNELPDPFTRDFEDRCEWWRYELRGGRYVRTYCPCRFGDQEVDYGKNVRGAWQEFMSGPPENGVPSAAETTQAAPAEPEAAAPAEEAATPAVPDVVDTAASAGGFSTLLAAAEAAGLVDALRGEGPLTVFAPTDDAFAALPEGLLDELLADPSGQLTQILLYHVVPGAVMAADLSDGLEIETLEGTPLQVSITDSTVMVDGANVLAADIQAGNGVIHVIDAVMVPAPAEEVAGEETMAEEAMVEEPAANIVDTAAAASDFATLLAAVGAANLADTLREEGPFTVFAPTDDAFAALPEGALDALLEDPGGELTQVLLYHVVPGVVLSSDLADGMTLETLQGSTLTITIDGDAVLVDGANVVFPDVETTNGVIHVINAVLQPPAQ